MRFYNLFHQKSLTKLVHEPVGNGNFTTACSCPACLRGCNLWSRQEDWPLCPDSSLHAKAGSWQARNGFVHQQCGFEWRGFYKGMQLPCLLEGLLCLDLARKLAALPGLLFARESWFMASQKRICSSTMWINEDGMAGIIGPPFLYESVYNLKRG